MGTIRISRVRKCGIDIEELDKSDRRISRYAHSDFIKICMSAWKDNHVVCIVSKFLSALPTQQVNRRQNTVVMSIPNPIAKYNQFIGGVDLSDLNTEKYRISQEKMVLRDIHIFIQYDNCQCMGIV